MVYTLTLSPSLDYIVLVDDFKIGAINRSSHESYYPGGKGINVSIMLSNLGVKSKAIGFLGGFVGDFILENLKKYMFDCDFVFVDGISRINVKLPGDNETAINGSGPTVLKSDIDLLISKLKKLGDDDILVISGGACKFNDFNIYEYILENINKNVKVVVDTTKSLLISTLKYHPFLIKPNKEELEEALNVKINSLDDLYNEALKLVDMGAENVIVSLGSEGAILVNKNDKIYTKAISGNVINTVGAGDSLIAGFLYQYLKNNDLACALKFGACCGSASAFNNSLATKDEVFDLYRKVVNDNE